MFTTKLTLSAFCFGALLVTGAFITPEEGVRSTAGFGSPVERGAYLVTAIGCSDCHVPWHLGPNGPEPNYARGYSGHPEDFPVTSAPAMQEPWVVAVAATQTAWAGPWGVSFTANITPDRETGIGAWTKETFIAAIRTGKHLGMGRDILPPMPAFAYRNLTDEDLEAMFAYLMSQPAVSNRVPEPLPPAM